MQLLGQELQGLLTDLHRMPRKCHWSPEEGQSQSSAVVDKPTGSRRLSLTSRDVQPFESVLTAHFFQETLRVVIYVFSCSNVTATLSCSKIKTV